MEHRFGPEGLCGPCMQGQGPRGPSLWCDSPFSLALRESTGEHYTENKLLEPKSWVFLFFPNSQGSPKSQELYRFPRNLQMQFLGPAPTPCLATDRPAGALLHGVHTSSCLRSWQRGVLDYTTQLSVDRCSSSRQCREMCSSSIPGIREVTTGPDSWLVL